MPPPARAGPRTTWLRACGSGSGRRGRRRRGRSGGCRRPAGSRVRCSRGAWLERARVKGFFVRTVSGLVPLLLADEAAERAVLVKKGHIPLEAVPVAPRTARRGERHRDQVARVRGGVARSRLVAGRAVLGQIQSLGVQVNALGLDILQPCLVLAVGIGKTVDENNCLESIGAVVVERLCFVTLRFFVSVVAHHPPGAVVIRV